MNNVAEYFKSKLNDLFLYVTFDISIKLDSLFQCRKNGFFVLTFKFIIFRFSLYSKIISRVVNVETQGLFDGSLTSPLT